MVALVRKGEAVPKSLMRSCGLNYTGDHSLEMQAHASSHRTGQISYDVDGSDLTSPKPAAGTRNLKLPYWQVHRYLQAQRA